MLNDSSPSFQAEAPPKETHQSDIAKALQDFNSGIENLTNIVERGMKIYAATLGISPQAFTDDAVFEREAYRLAQEYHTARQHNIPREELGDEALAKESASEENSKRVDEGSGESEVDQLMSSPQGQK